MDISFFGFVSLTLARCSPHCNILDVVSRIYALLQLSSHHNHPEEQSNATHSYRRYIYIYPICPIYLSVSRFAIVFLLFTEEIL